MTKDEKTISREDFLALVMHKIAKFDVAEIEYQVMEQFFPGALIDNDPNFRKHINVDAVSKWATENKLKACIATDYKNDFKPWLITLA